jgi:hypothetical protein
MAGNATPVMKQFDRRLGSAGIHFLPGEAVGHGVVMAGRTQRDSRYRPSPPSIRQIRNGFPAAAVTPGGPFRQGTFAGAWQFLEGPAVQGQHQFGDVPIEFAETEEALVA